MEEYACGAHQCGTPSKTLNPSLGLNIFTSLYLFLGTYCQQKQMHGGPLLAPSMIPLVRPFIDGLGNNKILAR